MRTRRRLTRCAELAQDKDGLSYDRGPRFLLRPIVRTLDRLTNSAKDGLAHRTSSSLPSSQNGSPTNEAATTSVGLHQLHRLNQLRAKFEVRIARSQSGGSTCANPTMNGHRSYGPCHRRSHSDGALVFARKARVQLDDPVPQGLPSPLIPSKASVDGKLVSVQPNAETSTSADSEHAVFASLISNGSHRGHRRSLSDGSSPLHGMPEAFCRTVYAVNPPSRMQRCCLAGGDPPRLVRRRPPPINFTR